MIDSTGRKDYNCRMKQTAIVSEKGQVTIPKCLRDNLGIVTGTELEFEEDHGKLVARRVARRNRFDALVGIGDPSFGNNTDAILEEMRGPAWTPELYGPEK
jgi:antitoxin PrlF